MTIVHKAVAAVVRRGGGELLAFAHPLAGVQLPRGTVEPGETPVEGVLRELEEESGLRLEVEPRLVGEWTRVLDGRFGEAATHDVHLWHLFVIEAPEGLPDRWTHHASGSPEEEGLAFAFRWLPVDEALPGRLDPVFGTVCGLLLAALSGGA